MVELWGTSLIPKLYYMAMQDRNTLIEQSVKIL